MANTPFATLEELETYWKDIVEAEEPRAENLLLLASDRLRLIAEDIDYDLQTKYDENEAYKSTVKWVVMEAVKRAMQTGSDPDMPSVESAQITAGPYSQNYKYTNPTGDLFFRKAELAGLGLYGRQTLSSIGTAPNTDIYIEGS